MKIDLKNLKRSNQTTANKLAPIHFFVARKNNKLIPLNYQAYTLYIDLDDEKSAAYLIMVRIYKVGTMKEWLQFMDVIEHGIKEQGIKDYEAAYMLVKEVAVWKCLTGFPEQR
eukprot:14730056-Ditylum_brightwellii.AAC.1